MMHNRPAPRRGISRVSLLWICSLIVVAVTASWFIWKPDLSGKGTAGKSGQPETTAPPAKLAYEPRQQQDASGNNVIAKALTPWKPTASLSEISAAFQGVATGAVAKIDAGLSDKYLPDEQRVSLLLTKALLWNYDGEPQRALEALAAARTVAERDEGLARRSLYNLIMHQGISALRRGENENCILCRGESSCILPISPKAVHTNPEGSRLAIQYFTEYLAEFPDDLGVRWLLNIAHMTLGEYPDRVDPRYLVPLEHFLKPEFDIGKFKDIGDKVKVNRLNQAGGSIMDDFDNDGLLDIVTTTMDATVGMTYYHNDGAGHFENRATAAGLDEQLGGLNCRQTDYNNDGFLDIFIVRGAWFNDPMRPSLLRNNKDGTFTDVTEEAGLLHPANSITAAWADYNNDGWLDLYVCCETQTSRLYLNLKNGTFEDVTRSSGIYQSRILGKGAAWIDYDNDGDPDLFVNYLTKEYAAQLFRNNGNGTFDDVSESQGIRGPVNGFSCWTWDYDNDGWQDIFATSFDRELGEAVKGLQGKPHSLNTSRLYHNRQGQGFEDVTHEAGLDAVYLAMGSNFADFDNDGYLDMYLGTGEPDIATLVPNRMFKNVNGRRFAEITASSGTGNLQKGHGVSCGDWDRDGNIDLFIEMGGAVPGDQYHNILFQNPGGHGNRWLSVKLIGEQTNRAAIGARIKVVTAGTEPRTIHRDVSSGSSFGGNPLQQSIGLGRAEKVHTLEIFWPRSKATQTFHDLDTNQAIEITEFATDYRKLEHKAIPVPP